MKTVYRTDSRVPQIVRAKGFEAKKPMGIEMARAHLLSYCTNGKSPLDLSQYIISSTKDEYVSTSFNTGCGGKSNGYIYEIRIDDLRYVDWSKEVLGVDSPRTMPISPKLLLNADKLSDATIIAIDSNRDAKEGHCSINCVNLMRVGYDPHFLLTLKLTIMDIMSKKHEAVPKELLTKEFLSQFKTEQDVSQFLKHLHS